MTFGTSLQSVFHSDLQIDTTVNSRLLGDDLMSFGHDRLSDYGYAEELATDLSNADSRSESSISSSRRVETYASW